MKNIVKYILFSISSLCIIVILLTAYTDKNETRFATAIDLTTYAERHDTWLTTTIYPTLYTDKNTTWFNMGQSMQEVVSLKSNYTDIVALVNGQEINKRDIESTRIISPLLKGRMISRQEALNESIREVVVIQEAQKRGLYPSREETLAFMEIYATQMKEFVQIKDSPDDNMEVDLEYYYYWRDYLSGLGITEDEFWVSEETIQMYQYILANNGLRNALTVENEWYFDQTMVYDTDPFRELNEMYQQAIDELIEQSTAEILDVSFLQ